MYVEMLIKILILLQIHYNDMTNIKFWIYNNNFTFTWTKIEKINNIYFFSFRILNPRSTNPNTQKNSIKRKATLSTLNSKKRLRTDISNKSKFFSWWVKCKINEAYIEYCSFSW